MSRATKMTVVMNCDDLANAVEQYERYTLADGVDEQVCIDGTVRKAMPHRCMLSDDPTPVEMVEAIVLFGKHESDIDTLAVAATWIGVDTPHSILCIAEDLEAIARHYRGRA